MYVYLNHIISIDMFADEEKNQLLIELHSFNIYCILGESHS